MTTHPIPRRPHRAHPYPHAQPAIPLDVTTPNTRITRTVMPAHTGIQRLDSCGVQP